MEASVEEDTSEENRPEVLVSSVTDDADVVVVEDAAVPSTSDRAASPSSIGANNGKSVLRGLATDT